MTTRMPGAVWMDRDVVVDRGIISSRQPADLPVFVRALIGTISDCGVEAAIAEPNPAHRAANCRWGYSTLFLEAPLWWEAERCPWAWPRGMAPHLLETTEVCHSCVHWSPRPARAPGGRAAALTASGA